MKRVIYAPEAEAELIDAIPYYGAPPDKENDPFLDALNEHVLQIAKDPRRFPIAGRGIRRCVVKRFPFIILFRECEDHIRILAVAHTSRHPSYWKHRA